MKPKHKGRRKPFVVFGHFTLKKGERELTVWSGLEYGPDIALRKASKEMWADPTVRWKHIEEAHFNVKGITHEQYHNLARQARRPRRH